ncbi:uncharacterized protein LOC106671914 [Cimex lectularius]|uniref:Uncharacterized protein n=1 Tax=Cimex lectularius TaxID=79782 RepID=A0A8I6S7L3_CIMLE|nr:uncharacterized protein LOC106671914 [Cimex lectularius]
MDFIPETDPDDILKGFKQLNVEPPDWFFNPQILFNRLDKAWEAKAESEARRNREHSEAFERKKADFEKHKKQLEESIKNANAQCEQYGKNRLTLELQEKEAVLAAKLKEVKANNIEISARVESACEEVIRLEAEKEEYKENLVKQRDTLLDVLAYYKTLCLQVDYEPPDIFRVYPSDEDRSKWIEMRSDDFKYWEVVDTTFDEKTKDEMRRMLVETSNPALVVASARKTLVG